VAAVTLEAVKFNHDHRSASADAINIRRNREESVRVPEWRRGISVRPDDSPAAYAISETRGNKLTIQAQFYSTSSLIRSIEVRAVNEFVIQGCLYEILKRLGIKVHPPPPVVLSRVIPRKIELPPLGFSKFARFDIEKGELEQNGIGAYFVPWRWEYRLGPTDHWKFFDRSDHLVYAILDLPTSPWTQTPYDDSNTQLPWTEVLEYSCRWARGMRTSSNAACRITESIYDIGETVMEYDCPGGGSSHYSWPNFNCTAFLDRIKGGVGMGQYVNCSDCATFVSAFANILGCDLWQSKMGWGFGLNPALAIGSEVWRTPCGWPSFSYHEVAWTGECNVDDTVYDACLKVDGDEDPTSSPHTPMLVCGMRFGNPGDGDYRDRLASPSGRPNCNPLPSQRLRRTVW